MEKWQKKKTKITWEDAAEILYNYLHEADTDELAVIFEHAFGYDVEVEQPVADEVDGIFICTPNKNCAYVLGENPEWPRRL